MFAVASAVNVLSVGGLGYKPQVEEEQTHIHTYAKSLIVKAAEESEKTFAVTYGAHTLIYKCSTTKAKWPKRAEIR